MLSEITQSRPDCNGVLVDYSPDCVKLSIPYAKGVRVFFLKPGEAEAFAASLEFAAKSARQLDAQQLRMETLCEVAS